MHGGPECVVISHLIRYRVTIILLPVTLPSAAAGILKGFKPEVFFRRIDYSLPRIDLLHAFVDDRCQVIPGNRLHMAFGLGFAAKVVDLVAEAFAQFGLYPSRDVGQKALIDGNVLALMVHGDIECARVLTLFTADQYGHGFEGKPHLDCRTQCLPLVRRVMPLPLNETAHFRLVWVSPST